MPTQKPRREKQQPVAPPPEKKPKPVEKTACDPLPAKDSKEETNRPPCPEGYQDRQPVKPPDEDPEQRAH